MALAISGLEPDGMPTDAVRPFTLSVRAEEGEFLPGDVIVLGGQPLTTEYMGPTELQALVSDAPGGPGTVSVSVTQGGTASENALPFTWTAPEPPPTPNLFSAANVPYPYLRYDIQTRYVKDNGTLLMPIAGPPGTPAAIIQVCAPSGRKVVDWVLERQGADPEPPAPADDPANGIVLERQEIRPISKLLMADGLTHVHRMSGQYVYLLTLPLDETGPLQIGSPPYDLTPPEENVVSPGQYLPGIS